MLSHLSSLSVSNRQVLNAFFLKLVIWLCYLKHNHPFCAHRLELFSQRIVSSCVLTGAFLWCKPFYYWWPRWATDLPPFSATRSVCLCVLRVSALGYLFTKVHSKAYFTQNTRHFLHLPSFFRCLASRLCLFLYVAQDTHDLSCSRCSNITKQKPTRQNLVFFFFFFP